MIQVVMNQYESNKYNKSMPKLSIQEKSESSSDKSQYEIQNAK